MGIKFKKGAQVRQVTPVIVGEVVSIAIVDDEVQYEVGYTTGDGQNHARFFKEEELELSADPAE